MEKLIQELSAIVDDHALAGQGIDDPEELKKIDNKYQLLLSQKEKELEMAIETDNVNNEESLKSEQKIAEQSIRDQELSVMSAEEIRKKYKVKENKDIAKDLGIKLSRGEREISIATKIYNYFNNKSYIIDISEKKNKEKKG